MSYEYSKINLIEQYQLKYNYDLEDYYYYDLS